MLTDYELKGVEYRELSLYNNALWTDAKQRSIVEDHCLKRSIHAAMLIRCPKPDIGEAVSPKLVAFISDFAGELLNKAHDSSLQESWVQCYMLQTH